MLLISPKYATFKIDPRETEAPEDPRPALAAAHRNVAASTAPNGGGATLHNPHAVLRCAACDAARPATTATADRVGERVARARVGNLVAADAQRMGGGARHDASGEADLAT